MNIYEHALKRLIIPYSSKPSSKKTIDHVQSTALPTDQKTIKMKRFTRTV